MVFIAKKIKYVVFLLNIIIDGLEKIMKKKVIAISSVTFLFIFLTIGLYFATNLREFEVVFNSNGGSSAQTQMVKKGKRIVEPEIPVKQGYTFEGWYLNLNDSQPFNFDTEVTSDMKLIAKWSSANTKYIVNHYKMDLDGSTYSMFETENKLGLTDTSVTPEVKTYDGFTSPITQTVNISADGSTLVNYYYTRNKYNITLTYNTGISEVSGSGEYYYEEEVPINATLLAGYSFDYWITDDGTRYTDNESKIIMGAKDISLTGNATPNTYTTYTVKHYKMNLDGSTYAEPEIETFTGTTDAPVSPAVKTYEGFTSPEVQTTNVNGDGSAIIEYYYTRNKYNVILNSNIGISNVIGSGEYYYEEKVSIMAELLEGYSFDYWINNNGIKYYDPEITIIIGTNDISLTANATANEDTPYTVKHYKMNLDGSTYAEPEIETFTGTTDTSVTPDTKTYEGFTSPDAQTINIDGDGNAIVEYYYSRNKYTVTLNSNIGISDLIGSGEYYYEEEVSIIAELLDGYSFDYWINDNDIKYDDSEITIIIGTNDISLTANATANEDTPYTVKHYKMNLDGSTYAEPEIETFTGTTDTSVTPDTKTYEGFTSPEIQTINIDGDGNAIVEYYYSRNKYTITLNSNIGISEVIGSGEYYYEEEVSIIAELLDGYSFDYWIDNNQEIYKEASFNLKIGISDITLTANATANEDTIYNVMYYKMNLDGSTYAEPEIETLTGITDTSVTPEPKPFEGFTSPDAQTIKINGDGSSFVKYYYTRNTYDVSLTQSKGVSKVTGSGTYYYEQKVEITAELLDGYSFDYWIDNNDITYNDSKITIILGANNVSLTAIAKANTNTPYTVEHYKMNLDGSTYAEPEIEHLTGTTDTSVTPNTRPYDGFTAPETETITIDGNGQSIVKYYYTRNTYDVSLTPSKGISKVTGSVTYYYEQEITITVEVLAGYTFDYWIDNSQQKYNDSKVTIILGANDISLTAIAKANTNTPYTVEHYKMNLDGSSYAEPEIEHLTGTTDASVTPNTRTYDGFTAPEAKTITIDGNGQSIVKYLYSRNKYPVTITPSTGISKVTGSGEYYYEQEITITAEVLAGYTFDCLIDNNQQKYNDSKITLTQGTTNISLTAIAKANTNTPYTVEHYKMNLDGSSYAEPEIEHLTGTTDASVTPNTRTYDGFTAPEAKTITIDGNGQSIVKYLYSRNKYPVTLTPSTGISKVTGSGEYYYEQEITITAEVLNGYTFDYWIDNNQQKYNDSKVTLTQGTTNISLTATAKANEYTITYNTNGGTATVSEQKVKFGEQLTQPENPTYKGYTFIGWYIDEEASTPFDFNTTMPAKNITLIAKWQVNIYEIIFNSNGGQGTMNNQKLTYNKSANLDNNKFTRTGYTFAGWSDTENGPVKYEDNTQVTNLIDSGSINLYAVWNIVTYNITYDLADGTLSKDNPTTYTIETENIILNSPQKEGYKFKDWIVNNGAVLENNTIPKGTSGNLSLKAEYLLDKTVTVIFNSNNDLNKTAQQTIDFNYDTKLNVKPIELAKSYTITYNYNYPEKDTEVITEYDKFLGWTAVINGDVIYNDGDKLTDDVKNGDIINLYAKWEKPIINLKQATRKNYQFEGWSTSSDSSNIILPENYPLTDNLSLTAIWHEIPKIKYISFDIKYKENSNYEDTVGIGDNSFYLKIPNVGICNGYSLNITTTIPITLGKEDKRDPKYKDIKADKISEDGKSGTVYLSYSRNLSTNISSTDNINWKNPRTTIGALRMVDASAFKEILSSPDTPPLGIQKGFGISSEGIETPHYVTNSIITAQNTFVFFKEEGAPDINVKFVNGSKDILNMKIPQGSLVPNIGPYTIDNYNFVNWYSDSSFKKEFDFTAPIYNDITIYAKYTSKSIKTDWYYNNPNATSFTINSANDLKGLASLVNTSNINFSGKTIKLGNNIDLANEEWTPISNFKGTFDGNYHTISNLKISEAMIKDNLGLFGTLTNAKIVNLKFNNVNISTTTANNIGTVAGISNNSTLERISVNNLSLTGLYKIGGIVGIANGGTISECSTNGTISVWAKGDTTLTIDHISLGGILGTSTGKISLLNLYSGVAIKATSSTGASVYDYFHVGGIIGSYANSTNLLTMKYVLFTGTFRFVPHPGGIYCCISPALTDTRRKHNSFDNDSGKNKSTWFYDDSVAGIYSSNGTRKGEADLYKPTTYSDWDTKIWNIQKGAYASLKWLK